MSVYLKGRGAQTALANKFQRLNYQPEIPYANHEKIGKLLTRVFYESPRNILSKNDSPDIPFTYSINPYQGCEHGCVYCYARNSHEYWGFNASIDFESKIIAKPDAPLLLRKKFLSRSWDPQTVVMSGNTDCYQPVERKLKITRNLLKVFLEFGNPVGIITKNVLVLRDMDLLTELAKEGLVHIIFSITSLNEELRQKLEPRSSTAHKKMIAIRKLKEKGIPVSVMFSPVIPALNDHEIPAMIRESSVSGADDINMTLIRLNGVIGVIFRDWLRRNYPDRENKIINQIKSLHNGNLNESRFGYRMRGEGHLARSIIHLFKTVRSHYYNSPRSSELNTHAFRRNSMHSLF
ncbi:MAG: PA0069 family radical SAM protein [Cyclobacteriaceae bacterium]|jgi:DNA repair photolyase